MTKVAIFNNRREPIRKFQNQFERTGSTVEYYHDGLRVLSLLHTYAFGIYNTTEIAYHAVLKYIYKKKRHFIYFGDMFQVVVWQ